MAPPRNASFAEATASFSEAANAMRENLARPLDEGSARLDLQLLSDIAARADASSAGTARRSRPDGRARTGGRRGFGARQLATAAVLALVALVAAAYIPDLVSRVRNSASRSPATATVSAPQLPGLRGSSDDTTASLAPAVPKIDREPIQSQRPALASRSEPYHLQPPYEVADGLTFGPEGALKTRLAGVEGPARDAVCLDRDNRPWACGLQARAALNNAIRQANFACEPDGPPRVDLVVARCRTDDIDVARELVLAGFARATGTDPALRAAETEARREARGLWNGDWTIRLVAR